MELAEKKLLSRLATACESLRGLRRSLMTMAEVNESTARELAGQHSDLAEKKTRIGALESSIGHAIGQLLGLEAVPATPTGHQQQIGKASSAVVDSGGSASTRSHLSNSQASLKV